MLSQDDQSGLILPVFLPKSPQVTTCLFQSCHWKVVSDQIFKKALRIIEVLESMLLLRLDSLIPFESYDNEEGKGMDESSRGC